MKWNPSAFRLTAGSEHAQDGWPPWREGWFRGIWWVPWWVCTMGTPSPTTTTCSLPLPFLSSLKVTWFLEHHPFIHPSIHPTMDPQNGNMRSVYSLKHLNSILSLLFLQNTTTSIHPSVRPSVHPSTAWLSWRRPHLVLVSYGEHQGDEAPEHQGAHLHFAESFATVPRAGPMTVPSAPHLWQDVHGGHVQEGPSGEQHCHASRINIWQCLLTALDGRN